MRCQHSFCYDLESLFPVLAARHAIFSPTLLTSYFSLKNYVCVNCVQKISIEGHLIELFVIRHELFINKTLLLKKSNQFVHLFLPLLSIRCVSAVYQLCIGCVSAVYQLCISCVSAVYRLCIGCVSAVYQLCISCVSAVYLLCISCG